MLPWALPATGAFLSCPRRVSIKLLKGPKQIICGYNARIGQLTPTQVLTHMMLMWLLLAVVCTDGVSGR